MTQSAAEALAGFCERVLQDEALQAELAAVREPEAFAAAVVQASQRLGFEFDAAAVRARMQSMRIQQMMRRIAS